MLIVERKSYTTQNEKSFFPGVLNIHLLSINHSTAPIAIREKFSIPEHRLEEAYKEIKKYKLIESFFLVSTCNRTEFYFKSSDFNSGLKELVRFVKNLLSIEEKIIKEYSISFSEADVVDHAFNLTSGLNSLIIGERQILSQIKNSYSVAQKEKSLDNTFERLFQCAIQCAKEIHQETNISKGRQSVSSAAIDIANKIYGPLKTKNVLVLGAGRMAELALEKITNLGGAQKTYVLNRSPHRVIEFSENYKIDYTFPFEDIYTVMNEIDILICAAGAPHYIVFGEEFKKQRKNWNKKLTIIDISMPRNIDYGFSLIPNVEFIDIDGLQLMYNDIYSPNLQDINDAQDILNAGKEEFYLNASKHDNAFLIKDLKDKVETLRINKLKQASSGKEKFSLEEVDYITKNILSAVLHTPITNLKGSNLSQNLKEKLIRELFEL